MPFSTEVDEEGRVVSVRADFDEFIVKEEGSPQTTYRNGELELKKCEDIHVGVASVTDAWLVRTYDVSRILILDGNVPTVQAAGPASITLTRLIDGTIAAQISVLPLRRRP